MRTLTTMLLVLSLLVVPGLAHGAAAQADGPPPNDNYANATPIDVLPFHDAVSVAEAGGEIGETYPSCAPTPQAKFPIQVNPYPTVWYAFSTDIAAAVVFDASQSSGQVSLGIYDVTGLGDVGVAATAGTEIACARRNGGPLVLTAEPGREYMIQVAPQPGDQHVDLRATAEPAARPSNDDLTSATTIDPLPYRQVQDVGLATAEADEPAPSCASGVRPLEFTSAVSATANGPTTWFTHTAERDLDLVIDAGAGDAHVMIGVYDATGAPPTAGVGAVQEVACQYNSRTSLTASLTAGRTYAIQLTLLGTGGTVQDVTFSDAAELTEPPARTERFEATADDGTVLRGHVHLPAGDGPFATVLEFNLLWGQRTRSTADQLIFGQRRLDVFNAGFAVALVNVRGTGDSDGCLAFLNSREGRDAATVVEALADAPWSNGRVGMMGLGYSAGTAVAAMASGEAPSLAAVVAEQPVVDFWQQATNDGAVHDADLAYNTRVNALGVVVPRGSFAEDQPPGVLDAEHAACESYAVMARYDAPVWNADADDWHDDRDFRAGLDGVDVPVLATVGMLRDNPAGDAKSGLIRQLDDLWDLLDGPRWFVVGQHAVGAPALPEFRQHAVDWFDTYLRGPGSDKDKDKKDKDKKDKKDHDKNRGPQIRRADYQADDGTWHTSDSWQPTANQFTLHLDGQALTDQAPAGPGQRTYRTANHAPTGCEDPSTSDPIELLHASEPLDEDLHLAGQFTLDATISSTLPDGTISAMLYTAPADWTDCTELTEISHAFASLRHIRDRRGEMFPVDTPTAISVNSVAFATTVPAGHRLVLALGSSGWNTVPDPILPQITVHTGPDSGTRLSLPQPCDRPGNRGMCQAG